MAIMQQNKNHARTLSTQLLESRFLLAGDFLLTNGQVVLAGFSDGDLAGNAERLSISSDATGYLFELSEGVWSGADQAGFVEGNGGSVLKLFNVPQINNLVDGILVSDSLNIGISIELRDAQLSNLLGPLTFKDVGSVQQSEATTTTVNQLNINATSSGFELNDLSLTGNLAVTAEGDITDAAITHIDVSGDALFSSSANITLADDVSFDTRDILSIEGHTVFHSETNGTILVGSSQKGSLPTFGSTTVELATVSFHSGNHDFALFAGDVTINADSDISLRKYDFDGDGALDANCARDVALRGEFVELTDLVAFDLWLAGGPVTDSSGSTIEILNRADFSRVDMLLADQPNDEFKVGATATLSSGSVGMGGSADIKQLDLLGGPLDIQLVAPASILLVPASSSDINVFADVKFDAKPTRFDSIPELRFRPMVDAQSPIKIHGSVDLTDGNLNLLRGNLANLSLGDEFLILENDGTDPIVGNFANYPEGRPAPRNVTNSGLPSYITYAGGDGNDVALVMGESATLDFGDAPDGVVVDGVLRNYPVLLENDGARHDWNETGPRLTTDTGGLNAELDALISGRRSGRRQSA